MTLLTILLTAVLAFVVVACLGFAFVGGDGSAARTAKRTQAVMERNRGDKPRAVSSRQAPNDPAQRRKQILRSLKEQDKQLRKASMTLSARMQQAGLGASVKPFWIASGVLAAFGFIIPLALRLHWAIPFAAAFIAGFGLPRWVIGMKAKGRCAKFSSQFSDAIDIIVRGIKSGLPVHDCLKIIARECSEPLGSEFNLLVESIGMGVTVDQALEKMYQRMPTAELRFFTIVLIIQQKTGGNLAEALNNLSMVLRSRKLMREKVKALSGEAVASAWIIGCLPPGVVLLISIVSPTYMVTLFTDQRGHMLLLVAAVLMATGVFIMKRMMNFKV